MRILFLLAMMGLFVYFAMEQFEEEPAMDPKASISQAIDQAKQQQTLTPEKEAILRIQVAITDYVSKNGGPPDNLNQLVPTYFDAVPRDPKTNDAYTYFREGPKYRIGIPPSTVVANDGGKTTVKPVASATEPGAVTVVALRDQDIEMLDAQDPFSYDAAGKRDPFSPFDFSGGQDPEELKKRPPLQRLSLGQWRVTGIIAGVDGKLIANVEDASGKGYVVKVGTKIGLVGGEVIAVEKTLIKVLERTTDITGKVSETITEKKVTTEPLGAQKPR